MDLENRSQFLDKIKTFSFPAHWAKILKNLITQIALPNPQFTEYQTEFTNCVSESPVSNAIVRKADLPLPYLSVLFINWSIKKLYFRSFATGDENAAAYLKMIFILSCCCWKRKKLHDVCLKLPWSSSSSSKNLLLWSFIYNNCCQIQDSFILLLCWELRPYSTTPDHLSKLFPFNDSRKS